MFGPKRRASAEAIVFADISGIGGSGRLKNCFTVLIEIWRTRRSADLHDPLKHKNTQHNSKKKSNKTLAKTPRPRS